MSTETQTTPYDRELERRASCSDALMAALPDPDKLEALADWFDVDDRQKRRPAVIPGTVVTVQDDLRRWAALARAAIAKADGRTP